MPSSFNEIPDQDLIDQAHEVLVDLEIHPHLQTNQAEAVVDQSPSPHSPVVAARLKQLVEMSPEERGQRAEAIRDFHGPSGKQLRNHETRTRRARNVLRLGKVLNSIIEN